MNIDQIVDLIDRPVEDLRYELVEVNLSESRSPTLQIVVERADRKFMTIKDCEKVSRSLGVLLDVEEVLDGRHTLEITSPGVERPLNKLKHYERFSGYEALLKLTKPINDKQQIRCHIRGLSGEDMIQVCVQEDRLYSKETLLIPFSNIKQARLIDNQNSTKTKL